MFDGAEGLKPLSNAISFKTAAGTENVPIAAWSFDTLENGVVEDMIGDCDGTMHGCVLGDEAVCGRSLRFIPEDAGEVSFGSGITDRLRGKNGFTVSFQIQQLIRNYCGRIFTLYMADGSPGFQIDAGDSQIIVRVRSQNSEGLYINTYSGMGWGVWEQIVVSVDFHEKTVKTYLDGRELTPVSGSVNTAFAANAYRPGTPDREDVLGGISAGATDSEYMSGYVDELMIYGKTLSEEKISADAKVYETVQSIMETERTLYNSIRPKTETNAVLYMGEGDVLWNGEKNRLDPDDFAVVVKQDSQGVVYVPESLFADIMNKQISAADEAFSASPPDENGIRYIPAQEAAEKIGLKYWTDGGLLIIGDNPEGFTKDERTLMVKVFTAPDYPEPTAGHKYTRAVVQYSDYTKNGISLGSPCIIELRDGTLLASYDYNGANYKALTGHTYDVGVCISTDGGKTWTQQGLIENMVWTSIFENNGAIYAIGREAISGKVGIAKSEDLGKTWSQASDNIICSEVISAHCAPTPVVVSGNRIYRAFEDSADESGFAKWTYTKRAFILSAPVGSDLTKASSWTMSNRVPFERSWMPEGLSYGSQMGYLEGNVVAAKDGTIYDIVRIEADPQSGYACALKLSEDGKTLTFDRIFKLPCGKDKFTIRYDEKTGKYIAIGNLKTTPGAPAQRNVVGLCASDNLFDWEVKEILLVDDSLIPWHESIRYHGIQYPDFVISGEDLKVVTRDAVEETTYYHNANYIDFWQIKNFRSFLGE